MSVQIGINPLTWTNDDLPSLGAETPLDQCLAEGRDAGYSGFELGNKFPRSAATLGPILRGHGLQLVSGWYSAGLLAHDVQTEKDAVQDHLDLLAGLDAKVMVLAETTGCVHGDQRRPVSQRPRLGKNGWAEFGRRLTQLADDCLQRGVRVAYHPHMGTVVESEADVDALMAHTGDSVGLLLDTGHLRFAGADPLAVLARHQSRVCHVHCKDIRRSLLQDSLNRNLSFLDSVLNGVFTVPGDGCIDFAGLFSALNQADYCGWLVVEAEQDPVVAPSAVYANLGYRNIRRLCAQAGLEVSGQ